MAAERKKQSVTKTYEKYLLPIPAKVTETSTIVKYLQYFQELAEQANLKYVDIAQDMGAAAAALKVVWNCPEEFRNVIIHPGDFHVMKKNFQVNMDSYVFSFILFLFNIACCSQS